VQTLAQQALSQTQLINADVLKSIEAIIAELDRKLSEQINLIIHHEDFQKLEGAWRGLSYLVNNTETDETLKVRVMNITKGDLGKTLKRFKGTAWDQSPIFKKVYEEEYGQFGGEPFGCLVGDYYFDHSPQDAEMLGEMAKVSAAAHTPFISGVSPTVMQMDSWQELANPRDLTKIFSTPEYAAWRSCANPTTPATSAWPCRASCRACPTARAPARSMTSISRKTPAPPTTANTPGPTRPMPWRSTSTARSRSSAGARGSAASSRAAPSRACRCIASPPTMAGRHEMPHRDRHQRPPRGRARQERLHALIHRKNSDFAAFIGAQSLQKPAEYDDPDATANANLAARLPYLFACCRFAHYLKCIVRDKIGSFKERGDMERWLQNWIMNYVDGDPAHSTEQTKARRPLAAAEVVVEEVEGNPVTTAPSSSCGPTTSSKA
jgi:type VI secretion system protein ImpC